MSLLFFSKAEGTGVLAHGRYGENSTQMAVPLEALSRAKFSFCLVFLKACSINSGFCVKTVVFSAVLGFCVQVGAAWESCERRWHRGWQFYFSAGSFQPWLRYRFKHESDVCRALVYLSTSAGADSLSSVFWGAPEVGEGAGKQQGHSQPWQRSGSRDG